MNSSPQSTPQDDGTGLAGIFDLTGKVAVVTGGGGGIGAAIAKGLAQFGAELAVVDMDRAAAGKVADDIEAHGDQSLAVQADLTDQDDLQRMIDQIVTRFDRVDILVNSAGINIRKPALEVTESDWDKVVDINLKAVFFCTKAFGRIMVEQKSGKVINIASVMAMVGSPTYQQIVPYASSKGGVVAQTRAFATEWAQHNVLVNAIVPGPVATPLVKGLHADKTTRDAILRMVPLGRLAEPEEMVGPTVFLASRASDYVTGHILCVDGGWVAQ